MMRALLWREWREIRDTAAWWTAGIVLLAVMLRLVDEVVGISVVGCLVAISLGTAATTAERSPGVREFLLTRPVRRSTLLGAKLLATHGFLTLVLLFLSACSLLDLPGRVYGLIADQTAGGRIIEVDAPAFYPFAILFPNALLALVLLVRRTSRSSASGVALGFLVAFLAGSLVLRLVNARPRWFTEIAVIGALAAGLLLVALLFETRRRFRESEITGGAK